MVEYIHLRTLPAKQRACLCREFFIQVYYGAFSNWNQMEGPETWLPLMGEHVPDGQPMVHIIIAQESADHVVGGIVFEYLRESGSWLATYIAVRPDVRRHGIARRLMREMLNYIYDCTSDAIVFAETEDPSRVADAGERDFAEHRLRILDSFGLRQLPFHYVQPALSETKKPLDDLLLLCYAPDSKPPYEHVPAHRISDFLVEFYAALDQSSSKDLKEMCGELEMMGCIQVQRLTED